MTKTSGTRKRGVPVRKLNLLMAVFTLVISVILLVSIYRTNKGYGVMRSTADDFMEYQKSAYGMKEGSDYLTEQVRTFAETGDRTYLDNYFKEADNNKNREKALERLAINIAGSDAYKSLNAAMDMSLELMNTEYYSMRLTIEGNGYDISEFPEAVQNVKLSDEDAGLSDAEKIQLGRNMVFDENYRSKKNIIYENIEKCLEDLVKETDEKLGEEADTLKKTLFVQQIFVIILIVLVLLVVMLTTLLVISPLFRAIIHIRAEQPIPIKGSSEFRFLARTYNLMYEANKESKEQLAYEATHDNLTGVYNRNGYDFLINNIDFTNSAMLIIDVDGFKKINDAYGHETGDRALRRTADEIKHSFRAEDYVCRVGGDEFVVIMINVGDEHRELIVEKIEKINEKLGVEEDGMPAMSVSAGVAFGNNPHSSGDIFEDADEAMYRVKRNGKKGCAFY